jgi:hypothetical protein
MIMNKLIKKLSKKDKENRFEPIHVVMGTELLPPPLLSLLRDTTKTSTV